MRTHELMRQSRERKGLSAAALAEKAGFRELLVHTIERGAFDERPSGLYGRSAVRAYAKAVGLNPDDILAEVAGQLRIPEDPLDGLVRVHGLRPRPRRQANETREEVAPRSLDDLLENGDWRSMAAGAIDGGLLVFVSVVLIQLTAAAAGTGAADVLDAAAPALLLIVATVAITYFVLLGGVRNATFGSTLAGTQPAARGRGQLERVDASAALRRAAQCALRESSIVVEWLLQSEQARYCLRVFRMRRV
jgi:hypothetical protein